MNIKHSDIQLLSFQESEKWHCRVPWGWQTVVWKLEQLDTPCVVHKQIRHSQGTLQPVTPQFTVCVDLLPPAGWQKERKLSAENFLKVSEHFSVALVHAGIWVSKGNNFKKYGTSLSNKYKLCHWQELIRISPWHLIISNNLIWKQPLPTGPYSDSIAG